MSEKVEILKIEMTPEKRKQWSEAAIKIIDIIGSVVQGPREAMIFVHMILEALSETAGVELKAHFTTDHDVDINPKGGNA